MRIILNKSNNQPIGFFDSGVGGVTVFDQVKKLLPYENYLYFGDTKHMPYGEKSEKELLKYADEIFRFLEYQGAKAVIMACNTTSAVVYEKLKNNYNFEIYPIIQSVSKLLAHLPIKRIGILATPATINSHCYAKEIAKHNKEIEVYEICCPQWVKIVEEGRENDENSKIAIAQKLDEIMTFKPEKIVLGCTHYPYLENVIEKFLPLNMFINPALPFAEFIKADLEKKELLNHENIEPYEKFFVSAAPQNFIKAASMFYNVKNLPELIDFSHSKA